MKLNKLLLLFSTITLVGCVPPEEFQTKTFHIVEKYEGRIRGSSIDETLTIAHCKHTTLIGYNENCYVEIPQDYSEHTIELTNTKIYIDYVLNSGLIEYNCGWQYLGG